MTLLLDTLLHHGTVKALEVRGPLNETALISTAPGVNYVAQERRQFQNYAISPQLIFPPSPRLGLLLMKQYGAKPTSAVVEWLQEMRESQRRALEAANDWSPLEIADSSRRNKLDTPCGNTNQADTALETNRGVLQELAETKVSASTGEVEQDPYAFQNGGIRFLRAQKRVLCADDTGIGKTRSSLLACKETLDQGGNVLVLTLKNLAVQWQQEGYQWLGAKQKTLLLHQPVISSPAGKLRRELVYSKLHKLKGVVVIANWDALLALDANRLLDKPQPFTTVVGDEAHVVCNKDAKRSKAMKRLCARVPNVYLLTGTPLEKTTADMWHLLHLLEPRVFSSYWAFYAAFVDFRMEWNGSVTELGPKNLPILQDLIRPYYIRRTRTEVLKNVKEPIIVPHALELTPKQAKLYEQIEKETYLEIKAEAANGEALSSELNFVNAVSRLIRLRQCVVDGNLLLFKENRTATKSPNFDNRAPTPTGDETEAPPVGIPNSPSAGKVLGLRGWQDESSFNQIAEELDLDPEKYASDNRYHWAPDLECKLTACKELLTTSFTDKRVVIFVSFRLAAIRLAEMLGPKNSILYLSGLPVERHRTFSAGKGPLWLISTPDSLGTGANLQSASEMFYIDLPWSGRLFKQSLARIVRIGQEAQTYVKYFYVPGTVDERVHELLQRKMDTFEQVAVARAVLDHLERRYA